MTVATAPVDAVFRALSDPTRRQVLERLTQGPASVSELAEPFDMKLPSFVQHLGILEECRLVSSEKKGRVRTYRIDLERMKLAEEWLASQRKVWETRLDRLDEYLKRLNQRNKNQQGKTT